MLMRVWRAELKWRSRDGDCRLTVARLPHPRPMTHVGGLDLRSATSVAVQRVRTPCEKMLERRFLRSRDGTEN